MDLTPFYPWIVLIHVVATFGFAISHGVSAYVAFGVRARPDPDRIRSLLELSGRSIGAVYGSLLVLLAAGIVAGVVGGHFGRGWIWAAIVVLVAEIGAMYGLASRYYVRVRAAVGMRTYGMPEDVPDPVPLPPDELATLLDTRRPELIALVGLVGFVVLLWLMVVKPF
jgi:hypothetical protein